MARNLPCRVCGERRTSFLCTTFNEHTATSELSIHRCLDCGSVFVGNALASEELGAAYATFDSGAYYEEIKRENGRKIATAIANLKRHVVSGARIIDLGAGNGAFAEGLLDNGFCDVSVHEIPGADLSRVAGRVRAVYRDHDHGSVPTGQFDVVTLLDVLEHVPDPRRLVAQCARMLAPGGLIYFHTPVVTRTDRMMHGLLKVPMLDRIGRIWQRGRTSIFHLENYTAKALTGLLGRSGLTVRDISIRNELSWPLALYVRIFLCEKLGLPTALAPVLAPLFYPLLSTNMLNANKAVVMARKAA